MNEDPMSMCIVCGTEMPLSESNRCEVCGLDGLCNNCIGDMDHKCSPPGSHKVNYVIPMVVLDKPEPIRKP